MSTTTFLNCEMNEDIYMDQSTGFENVSIKYMKRHFTDQANSVEDNQNKAVLVRYLSPTKCMNNTAGKLKGTNMQIRQNRTRKIPRRYKDYEADLHGEYDETVKKK